MTESRTSTRTRAGFALALAACLGLVLSDPSSMAVLAKCLVLGEGRFFGQLPDGEFEVDYFGHRYTGSVDNTIDWYVYVLGGWEHAMLAAMADMMALSKPDGGVFVDVGANVGTHTLYMANHAKVVHAIEPWPTVLDRLDATLKANAIDNVVVHPVGFAQEPGTLPYNIPPDMNLGMGSFSRDLAEQRDFADRGQIDLPLVVADDYFDEHEIGSVDVVKIDIEGYEKGALRGMARTLTRDRPAVVMELNVQNEEGFHSEQELRDVFPDGYEFFELVEPPMFDWKLPGRRALSCGNDAGNYSLEPFDMDFSRGERDVVAMPRAIAERMNLTHPAAPTPR